MQVLCATVSNSRKIGEPMILSGNSLRIRRSYFPCYSRYSDRAFRFAMVPFHLGVDRLSLNPGSSPALPKSGPIIGFFHPTWRPG